MPALFYVVIMSLLVGRSLAADVGPSADPAAYPEYDLQMINAKPGRLAELHDWFRAHQQDVLAKHGATSVAFMVPVGENPEGKLLVLLRYPGLESAMETRRALRADPAWAPMDPTTDSPEVLVQSVDHMALRPTDYSPVFAATQSAEPRVFELRTYTCPTREHLFLLHERFREHTMGLFKKHGMENLVYWNPKGMEDGELKLVYLLGHRSQDAAKESFGAFRRDPEWLAAKEASEKRAGGSLTEKEKGVVSEFLVGTDYSPLK